MFFALFALIGILTPTANADASQYFMDASYVHSYNLICSNGDIDGDEDEEQDATIMVNKKAGCHKKKPCQKNAGKFLNISINDEEAPHSVENTPKENATNNKTPEINDKMAITQEFSSQRLQHLAIEIAKDLGYTVTITAS